MSCVPCYSAKRVNPFELLISLCIIKMNQLMLVREMSVYLITVLNIYYVGKSCRFLMLKQLVCIVTAELDGVRETYE